ncbi:Retrovirus-related Pol polyprotein from transposon opus, partial [Dictyocoela muelleri]
MTIKDTEFEIKNLIIRKMNNPLLGKINTSQHSIKLESEFKRVLKEYPVPIGLQNSVKEHLEELIRNDIIEEKDCHNVSPAFVIKKKNGKLRLVVDFWYLNSITKKTHNTSPKIYETLAKLKDPRVFLTIDLNNGYYQICMKENDIEKTAFAIMNKTYVFKRMPFGLCNAPATFQRCMGAMFRGINNIIVYMDDILV